MTDCLFCKIANGELDTKLIYEDDDVVAFEDINPVAPMHCLIIPRQHISTINDLTLDQSAVIGQMTLAGKEIAKNRQVDVNGYRLVMNCNADGGQTVFHIHMHLLAGRSMVWPPG